MGEKPNEQDEAARESGMGSASERESPTRASAGRESPTRASAGRGPAAVADLDEDGMTERKMDPRGGGKEAERAVAGGLTDPTPAEASNLNLSKSNIERAAADGGSDEPAEGTKLNSSKSNRVAGSGENGPGDPPEATNLNSSRSN